jgi:subtilisin-like proprotein convertase family protein
MSFISLYGQSWVKTQPGNVIDTGKKDISPNNGLVVRLEDNVMKSLLWESPVEGQELTGPEVNIMMADGSMDQFRVVEYQMMEEGLAKKFPDIKTFIGISTTNPFRTARIDYTIHGFRAVIADLKGKIYIDPYQQGDNNHRIIYRKEEMTNMHEWSCTLDEAIKKSNMESNHSIQAGDCMLRTYRLAVAATGEYTAFHGGTVVAGISAITTAINRVNQIYEQDLAVSFDLVANNDLLVYTNAATDPYSNSSGGTMLGQNQTNVDAVIGSANYDVGHVFSTGGGGIASLGVICNNSFKARGVTGLPSPTGDPFYIDYVSHEIGHQFGGNHTFNGTQGSCSGGNRNNATAMEPGSGSTIMGYAGICGPSQNVQNQSDAYFHAISIQEITVVTNGTNCAAITPITPTNNAPSISPLLNYTVPVSTPLVLDAIVTDPDMNDVLTFCWEQMDNEVGLPIPPASTATGGAVFRSLTPKTDSKRYLPALDDILNGTSTVWEVLPSVERIMNFRLTVRDHALVPGCTAEDNTVLNFDGASGPFVVNSLNTPAVLLTGQNFPLLWDVANTDVAPVSCSNVDILLSTDGGMTYPITLVAGTPNDGSYTVTIPANITTSGRIMVKGSDNIFFDINDADFEIQSSSPTFTLSSSPASGSVCNSGSIQFDVLTSSILSFNDPINLSISGLPTGASVSFNPSSVTPGNTSVVTLNNFGANTGPFNLTITGMAAGQTKTTSYDLTLEAPVATPVLIAPADMATGINGVFTMEWNSVSGATSYAYEISTTPSSGGNIESGNTSSVTVTNSITLNPLSTYYWRIGAINNCGISWSSYRSFTTNSCQTVASTDVPKNISSSGTPTVTSTLYMPANGTINDVNILNLTGTHTWIRDLRISVSAPGNTSVILLNRVCSDQDNFDIDFDDDAVTGSVPCPPTDGNAYQPSGSLSVFNGLEANGTWTLTVEDLADQDGGSLASWSVEVCYTSSCQLNVNTTSSSGAGSLADAVACAAPNDVITLSSSLVNKTIDLGGSSLLIDKNLTIEANPLDKITLTSSSNSPTITLETGTLLTLKGFSVVNTSVSAVTLFNQGTVILENMIMENSVNKK